MLGPGWLNELFGSNNSDKPKTNTVWVRSQLCKLQKGCTRLAAASDKVYQLLAQVRWFSPGTSASSTTKTGSHDIVESGVKHQNSNSFKFIYIYIYTDYRRGPTKLHIHQSEIFH